MFLISGAYTPLRILIGVFLTAPVRCKVCSRACASFSSLSAFLQTHSPLSVLPQISVGMAMARTREGGG